MPFLVESLDRRRETKTKSEAGRARTDDDQIMSSEAMTGSNTVERGWRSHN
jgi:hypothetical protein